jgi:glycosyltransferase involved in cell wall biosynthesis
VSAVKRIDQIVAGFAEGDAISSEAMLLRAVFQRMGVESQIYVVPDRVAPEASMRCRALDEYEGDDTDIVIHHYSIASPATDLFLSCPGKKVLMYHNITPESFFEGFDDRVVGVLRKAREDLVKVAESADEVWAVSRFNAFELGELGIENVKVFPLLFNSGPMDFPPEPRVVAKFAQPMTNILSVGRIAPNKCIEELILSFAWYNKSINPFSRLIIVGSERSSPRYFAMLRMLAGEMDLANVCFERFASPAGLIAYYEMADVFVSTSRHEGYCLPLIEAMYKGVPVLARAQGGMIEAMGGGGVLFDDMTPLELAELIHRTCSDQQVREEILSSQKDRIHSVLGRHAETEVKDLLADYLD